ncbi:MAG: hypothetical protein ACTSP7_02575, partial [Candidatus Heimdallarchaeota archaeon]
MSKKKKINSQYKILAITGRSAENLVRNFLPKNVDLKVLPINVAAFITQRLILKNISEEFAKQYDIIIVPTDLNEGVVKSYLPIMLHSETC